LVLGVDGGTSKTLALVADISTASIVGFGSAGGSNFQANGLSKSGKEIQKAIEQASRGLKSALFIEAAFCMSGADRPKDYEIIRKIIVGIGFKSSFSVYNDLDAILYSGQPDGGCDC